MGNAVRVGSGEFVYDVVEDFEKLPPGYSWTDAAAVVVDSQDRVYVFNRGDHPMIVFDRDGNFLSSWGEGVFSRAHGVTAGPDDTLYCADDGDHTIRQCTLDGKVLMTLGVPGKPSAYQAGDPFNRCTDVAIDPRTGDLYVSDGYGNSRVHKYSPDGKLLFSWGGPGTDPGEFNIVHNIATDRDGWVYVADRENHRVQIFDSNGKFETQWVNMHRPCAIYISEEQHVYVGELGTEMKVNRELPNIGPRISVYDNNGKRLARVGESGLGTALGQFIAPHGMCVDSRGDLYLGEVAWTNMNNLGLPSEGVRSFQKLVKVD
ncbi:MAG: peptidyl-alpha-hydroxyglycine alpha-amidating lyase family protein [SAR202 cluster bacterium]|nr:peptidyl-alpha-hydroxyglycine alpha-amidating lyase family protein [SAR202 cluster bacterium]